jgi:hypothetical protein
MAIYRARFTSLRNNKLIYFTIMPILLVIAILLGGSSFAAEGSLPGDILYPVKINVNEQVRGLFSFSEEAKAEWEARVAERRLEEAESLSSENNLSLDARAKIQENFTEYADRVEARIETLSAKDPEKALELAGHFEISLKAHSNILNSFAVLANTSVRAEIHKLSVKVDEEGRQAGGQKSEAEQDVRAEKGPEVQSAAEGKRTAAINKIAEVRKQIERIKIDFGAQAAAQAETRLKLADSTLLQGNARFDASAYGEAFILFQKAHSIAQEAQLLIEAKNEFERVQVSKTPKPSVSGSSTHTQIENESEMEVKSNDVDSDTRLKVRIGL